MNTKDFNLVQLLQKPVAMMTGEELRYLLESSRGTDNAYANESRDELAQSMPSAAWGRPKVNDGTQAVQPKRMFFGIEGIAQIFGCSVPTANHIKKSGVISDAITQVGRKIIIDGDKALALVKANGGRRC